MAENTLNDNIIDVEDLVIEDDVLYANNTFSLKALNDTLEKLSVTNFWSLYQTQRSRLRMKRFDIPFNEFLPTKRLLGEKKRSFYPKRNIAYVDYTFIEPELRKKYRNSVFYNVAVNQNTISKNPGIFKFNYMVFINGEYIFTTEVYPVESKLGIIIDIENTNNEHGITLAQYNEYRETNPMVTVVIVPNFNMVDTNTNRYILEKLDYTIPFNRIPGSDSFTNETLCFVNSTYNMARRYYDSRIRVDKSSETILVDRDISPGDALHRFCFVTLNYLKNVTMVSYDDPYFRVENKMPTPTEQMITFVSTSNGMLFKDLKIELYYPNIYKVTGLEEGETAKVFVLQDEEELTENEKYQNDLAKYEEYIDMLPKFRDGTIPEIVKNYKPSSFVYSIDDYNNSMYVPSTLNYKVQKLHKTIYDNPWTLAVYLDLLNLPSDKFYIDVEKLDLEHRLRIDSLSEDIDLSCPDLKFDKYQYVFAINRHFANTRAYGFRIFVDGYFQTESVYTILPGPDFYYIYLPADIIKEDSVIEIERYKIFSLEIAGSTPNIDTPIELELKDKNITAYSRELYVVDVEADKYLNKEKDFKIEILYRFVENGERWVELPSGRNIPIENKIRVYLKNKLYVGRELRLGIGRSVAMHTGEKYVSPDNGQYTIFDYSEVKMTNKFGYDIGNYRMFNNGKLMLPSQYFVSTTSKQSTPDIIRTCCELTDGDRFTVDRVPARFTAIYYQNEIDKLGYVDLDGKVELPISLKWYDIYLNGVKLHKKNIEIITPTKFYIKGVDSRKNLLIVMKNRDPEVFKLATHNVDFDTKDFNNTVIDELMETIDELKNLIEADKTVIDPNNESKDIATNVIANHDALIFFFEYFVYTFINANYKQITQSIKDAFPSLIDENGVMAIDSNEGCIDSDSIAGYLVKLIECNYTDERSDDMFTGDSLSYDGLGTLQDRFAIRPLNTTNYQFGLPQEFMCDPETGEPAIMNDDGTVTTVSTIFRTKNFVESFSENIMMYGMGKANVYQITMDDEYKVLVYKDYENILTENISSYAEETVKKFAIGLDATFLTQVGDSKMLRLADANPVVEVEYLDGNTKKSFSHSINRLHNYVIEVQNGSFTLTSIKLNGISEGVRTFIHSLLLAF